MKNKFMAAALKEAEKAAVRGEVPVGAVVVKDGVIIAAAHNTCEEELNSLRHAEIIAVTRAMRLLKSQRLDGCDLYVTLEPCAMCCGAISHSRISRLYFGAYDRERGCVVSNLHCFSAPSPLFKPEYYCGIMEDECSSLLSDFFKKVRSDKFSTFSK